MKIKCNLWILKPNIITPLIILKLKPKHSFANIVITREYFLFPIKL